MEPGNAGIRSNPQAGPKPAVGGAAPPTINPDRTADEICKNVRIGIRAKKLLVAGMKPGQFLTLLVENRLYADAIRYMAHALLNREAVWWACLCARSAEAEALETMPTAHRQALGAAVRWVLEPTEAHRQAAGRSVEPAGTRTSAGAVARAAAFALGQSESHGVGSTPPNPILAARMAAASVLLAAKSSDRLRRFITVGLDVAYGHNRWD
ncbi:hypothetical protein SAMN05444166_6477 [Singulisphaera sp. GP187]|nr:hypothetical protein SAMN05444166_6477 [Singulisphaera sp. GP187]